MCSDFTGFKSLERSALGLLLSGGVDHHFAIVSSQSLCNPHRRLQTDRHQTVVDTGAYSVARHPMYAGAILTMYRDVALAGIVRFTGDHSSGLLIVRILIEEVLRQDLTGYDAYTKRIRYRLIPYCGKSKTIDNWLLVYIF